MDKYKVMHKTFEEIICFVQEKIDSNEKNLFESIKNEIDENLNRDSLCKYEAEKSGLFDIRFAINQLIRQLPDAK